MKINKMNKKSKKSVMKDQDNPVLTAPYIDKMSIVVDMPDPELHGQFVHELLSMVTLKEPGVYQCKGTKSFPMVISLFNPDKSYGGSGCVRIESTLKSDENPRVRVVFNPDKLFGPLNSASSLQVADDLEEWLDMTFLELWGGGFFEFLAHGRVTYIEIWRHILDRQPDDYLFRSKYAQTCQNVFGKSGNLETLYFGKGGSRQVTIYNKGAQLDKTGDKNVVRVEVRLKPTGLLVSQLYALKNPFKVLEVSSLKEPVLKLEPGFWALFKEVCRFRGVSGALKLVPAKMKSKLQKAVATNAVSFWEIAEEEWFDLWAGALQYAWLDKIPDHPAPLSMKVQAGE